MEHFSNLVNGIYLLTIFAKGSSILDFWQCSEYASECCDSLMQLNFIFINTPSNFMVELRSVSVLVVHL